MNLRDQAALAFFGTWMVIGLFLDGWAHEAQKPETFFSPWHGVLYSGFGGAIIFFGIDGWRSRRKTGHASSVDQLIAAGFILFTAGAFGDFIWHSIFGIEVDIEALLSPTHLLLMIGGLLMLGGPLRSSWKAPGETNPSLRAFLPTIITVTLSTSLVSFFLLYVSAFHFDLNIFRAVDRFGYPDFALQALSIGTILITNGLLMAPFVLLLRRWSPPIGSFSILFSGTAILMSGIHAFREAGFIGAAIAAGVTADLLVRRISNSSDRVRSIRVAAAIVPVVCWSLWFAVFHALHTLEWSVELWTGTIVLASITGVGLSALVFPPQLGNSRPEV